MAEDKVQLDVEVNGVEQSVNSVKDLKKALKDAKDEQIKAAAAFGEGSKEFQKATANVSRLKDKVEDLNDSTKSLKGSGIERASEGFSQLGEGLRNLDFDKVKIGLGALKSALAATGVMLVVQAVTYLIENFEELSNGTGIVAKVLQYVGQLVGEIKKAFNQLTDAIGATNTELDKMGEALSDYGDQVSDVISKQNAEFDRHIAIAKASGKNTVELEKLKQESIIRTNKVLVEQIISFVKAGGILNEEQKKLLSQSLDNIKNAKTQQTIIDLEQQEKEKDAYKKHLEEKAKALKESLDRSFKLAEDNEKSLNEARRTLRQVQKADELKDIDEKDTEVKLHIDEKKKKDYDDHKEFEKQRAEITLDSAQRTTNSLQTISDVFFEFKRKNLKKGSAEDIAAAKKQFNINKALGIANATIQGVQGVIAAYSSGAAIPVIGAVMGPVFAVLAGVAAAAQIAKISSAKFDESGGSAGSVSGGGGGAPSIPAPPTINTPNANTNSSTLFDASGKNTSTQTTTQPTITVKANVVETEMTGKQNEIKTIQNQSIF